MQNLNGYDAPWPAGGGANKMVPLVAGTYESNGITVTVSEDGYVHITGQKTVSTGNTVSIPIQGTGYVKAGQYMHMRNDYVSGSIVFTYGASPTIGQLNRIWQYTSDATVTGASVYMTADVTDTLDITLRPSVEDTNAVTAWTPYSNECLISGWSSLTVEQRGKNLYPASSIQGYAYSWYSHPNFADAVHPIFLKAGTTYVVSGERDPQYSNWFFLVRMFDTQGNNVDDVSKISGGIGTLGYIYVSGGKYFQPEGSGSAPLYQTITPAIDCYVDMVVQSNRGEATNAMVEIGSTPSATYVPYNPSSRSISISLGETVYSGYVDVATGVGEIDKVLIALTGTERYQYRNAEAGIIQAFWKPVDNIHPTIVTTAPVISSMFASSTSWDAAEGTMSVKNSGTDSYFNFRNTAVFPANNIDGVKAKVAELYAAGTPVSAVATLATPIPIQLTPQEVSSLAGDNVMWSDAGLITLKYSTKGLTTYLLKP